LHFDYNALGTHHRVSAPAGPLEDRHELAVRFERNGPGGALVLSVDGEDVASTEVPQLVRMLGSTGLDIGRDALSPVVADYEGPFAFTGPIESVVFSIRSRGDAGDVAAAARTELARE